MATETIGQKYVRLGKSRGGITAATPKTASQIQKETRERVASDVESGKTDLSRSDTRTLRRIADKVGFKYDAKTNRDNLIGGIRRETRRITQPKTQAQKQPKQEKLVSKPQQPISKFEQLREYPYGKEKQKQSISETIQKQNRISTRQRQPEQQPINKVGYDPTPQGTITEYKPSIEEKARRFVKEKEGTTIGILAGTAFTGYRYGKGFVGGVIAPFNPKTYTDIYGAVTKPKQTIESFYSLGSEIIRDPTLLAEQAGYMKGFRKSTQSTSKIISKVKKPKIEAVSGEKIVSQQLGSGKTKTLIQTQYKVKVGRKIYDIQAVGKELSKGLDNSKQVFAGKFKFLLGDKSKATQITYGQRLMTDKGSIALGETVTKVQTAGKTKYMLGEVKTGTINLFEQQGLTTQASITLARVGKPIKSTGRIKQSFAKNIKKQPSSVEVGLVKETVKVGDVTFAKGKSAQLSGARATEFFNKLRRFQSQQSKSKPPVSTPSTSGTLTQLQSGAKSVVQQAEIIKFTQQSKLASNLAAATSTVSTSAVSQQQQNTPINSTIVSQPQSQVQPQTPTNKQKPTQKRKIYADPEVKISTDSRLRDISIIGQPQPTRTVQDSLNKIRSRIDSDIKQSQETLPATAYDSLYKQRQKQAQRQLTRSTLLSANVASLIRPTKPLFQTAKYQSSFFLKRPILRIKKKKKKKSKSSIIGLYQPQIRAIYEKAYFKPPKILTGIGFERGLKKKKKHLR